MSKNIGQLLDGNVWQYGEYKQLIYLENNCERPFTNKCILGQAALWRLA